MSGRLPDQIDLARALAGGRSFAGELALSELPRLRRTLCEAAGDVRFAIAFERDAQGRATVLGRVDAVLPLECQRCLRPFGHRVSVEFALAAITRAEQADELPEHYDPLLIEDPLVRPRDLIEDELLLAVPLIPKHPSEHCGGAAAIADEASGEQARANPFAVLGQWRQRRTH